MQPRARSACVGLFLCEAEGRRLASRRVGHDDTGRNKVCCTALLLVTPPVLLTGCMKTAVVRLNMRYITGAEGSLLTHPDQQVRWLRQYCNPGRNCRCQDPVWDKIVQPGAPPC